MKRDRNAAVAAQRAVDEWNAKYPIGTRVRRWDLVEPLAMVVRGALPVDTVTRSEAWVASCQPIVKVEGKAGGWHLQALEVLTETDS